MRRIASEGIKACISNADCSADVVDNAGHCRHSRFIDDRRSRRILLISIAFNGWPVARLACQTVIADDVKTVMDRCCLQCRFELRPVLAVMSLPTLNARWLNVAPQGCFQVIDSGVVRWSFAKQAAV